MRLALRLAAGSFALFALCAAPAGAVTWDAAFGDGGAALTTVGGGEQTLTGVGVMPDGDIVAAGYDVTNRPTWGDLVIERLDPDGSLDAAFGTGGGLVMPVGAGQSNDYAEDLAVTLDGKIVVGGHEDAINDNRQTVFVARFLADGTPDSTFGTDGKAFADLAGGHDWEVGRGVAVQPDGRVVLAGSARVGDARVITVVRWTAAGALDPDFGTGGVAQLPVAWSDDAWDVALQPDGKIVVAGRAVTAQQQQSLVVARLTPAGLPDNSFGTDGIFRLANAPSGEALDGAYQVKVQSDGRIVAFGQATSAGHSSDWAVVRLTASGALDQTFAGDGVAILNAGPVENYDSANGLAIDGAGRIVLAGWTAATQGASRAAVGRLLATGSPDPGFDGDGVHVAAELMTGDRINAMTLDATGRPVVAGLSFSYFMVGRFALDPEAPPADDPPPADNPPSEDPPPGDDTPDATDEPVATAPAPTAPELPPATDPDPVTPVEPAADTKPPVVRVGVPPSISIGARGLTISLSSNERAQAVATLSLPRTGVVGRGKAELRPGRSQKLVVLLGKRGRRLMRGHKLALTLKIRVTDSTGNTRRVTRRVRLGRQH